MDYYRSVGCDVRNSIYFCLCSDIIHVCILFGSGVREGNRQLAESARHLRQYNDALLINDTLRMMDAYQSLAEFYSTKIEREIDGTDFFLVGLYQGRDPGMFLHCVADFSPTLKKLIISPSCLCRESGGAEETGTGFSLREPKDVQT